MKERRQEDRKEAWSKTSANKSKGCLIPLGLLLFLVLLSLEAQAESSSRLADHPNLDPKSSSAKKQIVSRYIIADPRYDVPSSHNVHHNKNVNPMPESEARDQDHVAGNAAGQLKEPIGAFLTGGIIHYDSSVHGFQKEWRPGSLLLHRFKQREFLVSPEWAKAFRAINQKTKIAPLDQSEIDGLSKYDISILIDKSASMNEELNTFLFGSRLTRWEWCRQQAESLSKQIARAFPSGITVIPFSSTAECHHNVSAAELNKIFINTEPSGMTMLDKAIGAELQRYLQKQHKQKPLLIAVITDGAPNDPQKAVDEIIEASKKVNHDDIRIVFFIIGTDPMANAFIDFVKKCHVSAGISFDIVSSHSFAELCQTGLARSLSNSVSQKSPANSASALSTNSKLD